MTARVFRTWCVSCAVVLLIITNSVENSVVRLVKSRKVRVIHDAHETNCSSKIQVLNADVELKRLVCLAAKVLLTSSDFNNKKQIEDHKNKTTGILEVGTSMPAFTWKRSSRDVSVSVEWGLEGSGDDANDDIKTINQAEAVLDLTIDKSSQTNETTSINSIRPAANHSDKMQQHSDSEPNSRWTDGGTPQVTNKSTKNPQLQNSNKQRLPMLHNQEANRRRRPDFDYYEYQDYDDDDYTLRSKIPETRNRYHGFGYKRPPDRYERFGYYRPIFPYHRLADNQAGLKNGKTFPKDDSDLRQDYRDPSPGEPSFPAAINPYDFYNPFLFPYFNPWGIAAVRNYQGLPFGQLPANAADIRNAHKISSSGLPWNVQSRYNNQGAEQQLPHQPIETGSQAGHDTYPPLPQANNSNSTSPSVDLAEHNNNHQSNQQPNTAAPSNTEPNNPHEATTPSYSCQTTTDRPLDPYQHSGAQDHEQTHYSPNDDAPAYDHESNYHHQDSGSDTYAENDDPRPEQEYSHHQEEPEANYESNEENQYEPHNDDSYNRRPPQPYNQQPRPEAMIQRPYHNQMRPQYPMRGPNTYGYPQQGYRPSGYYGFMYHPKYGGVAGIAIIISVVLLIGFLILASASLSSGRSIRTSLPNHNILKYSTYSNTTDDWNEPWRNWGTTVQAEETASDKHFDQHHICTILETICYAMHQSEKTAAFAGVFQFLDASLTDGPFRFGDVGLVGGLIKANGAYECPHLNSIC